MVRLDLVYSFKMKQGFLRGEFTSRLKTPDGITRRVPGVWVNPIPTYFN